MRIGFIFVLTVTALVKAVGASPIGITTPAQCFYGRVAWGGDLDLIGSWMEAHRFGHISFERDREDADLFVLDSIGQLRLANYPASVALRDGLGLKSIGPLEMLSKPASHDDLTRCEVDQGILHCWTRPGDCTFSHHGGLWLGQFPGMPSGAPVGPPTAMPGEDGPPLAGVPMKRNWDVEPVGIEVILAPCPPGPRQWEAWFR